MKAIISIKFLSEREIELRTFARDSKPNNEFSPIREKIKRKKIIHNTLTLAIKTGKEERHFAAWEYGGNFKFWSHDPSGYLMSVRFSEPDEELMKEIAKVLRRVRKFYILPGNFTLSCHVSQLGPTYPEAESILKDSCNAIKSELDPIAKLILSISP